MDKIVNIQNITPDNFQLQQYSTEDESLILNTDVNVNFDPSQDYLEYFVLDLNKNILYENTAGYPGYKLEDNIVVLDPQKDLESQNFTDGQYYTVYNFLKRKLSSSPNSTFYIAEISTDRTELRLNSTTISDLNIISLTQELASEIALSNFEYKDFYLNFGNNKLIIANNIALDNSIINNPTVLIKLYEPLPIEFNIQSQCWVVEQISESKVYQIELTTIFNITDQLNYISGPNLNISIQDQISNDTPYLTKNLLDNNTSVLGSGSLLYQINSILAEKGIEINIDYSDYSQFIHFSSAQTRLENFYYKLALIEEYTTSGSYTNSSPSNFYTSASQQIWDNKINEIITNFDGYEYYLYFNSESYAWPKTNSIAPYTNYSVNSPTAINWFTSQSYSASYFDSENNDNLLNTIPTYLREDNNNEQYFLFTQMVGQHFDNIWIYLKDITNKFDNDNRLNFGISKDLVAQAIRDLGVNIYQNNFSSTDIYSALLGLTLSGSNINIPYITGSLPTPTGYEYIDTFITSSDLNSLQPLDDVNKEIYKRIYHNLPYLLKKKGTIEGLKTLLNIYGIPDTIVRINEFGGESYGTKNVWDNFVNQYNYEFHTTNSGYINVPINITTGSSGGYGSAIYGSSFYGSGGGNSFSSTTSSFSIEFRFKTTGIPTNPSEYNQIIAYAPENDMLLVLEYNGSGYTSGSYNGSIPDPYNKYGLLKFISPSTGDSSSLYLPFFDGGWWSVLYNLDAAGTSNPSDWILNYYGNAGIWEDLGKWYDTEFWID